MAIQTTAKEQTAVEALKKYLDAYGKQDMKAALDCFSNKPDTTFIGTGIDDKTVGKQKIEALLKRDFAESQGTTTDTHLISANIQNDMAWIAAEVNAKVKLNNGQTQSVSGRCTTVLEKENNDWKIRHFHFSTPALNQPKGKSFPV